MRWLIWLYIASSLLLLRGLDKLWYNNINYTLYRRYPMTQEYRFFIGYADFKNKIDAGKVIPNKYYIAQKGIVFYHITGIKIK